MKRAADRSGCAAWCGLLYIARGVPFHGDVPMFVVGDLAFFFDAEPVWCSPLCRDERRGPVDSRLAADASAETPLQAAGGHADSSHAPAVGGKPVLSPPPAPAPGQRWLDTWMDTYSHIDILGVSDGPYGGLYFTITPGGGCGIAAFSLGRFRYLGPTPTETPSPAHPPTAVPLPPPSLGRAAVGAEGAPKGYVTCRRGCGRWTMGGGSAAHEQCWTCYGFIDGGARERFPDWTPSLRDNQKQVTAPTVDNRPVRPAGITCKRCLTTSEKGDAHLEACPVMRERGPSAVAMAPGLVRDTFADLADDWDLLPGAGR